MAIPSGIIPDEYISLEHNQLVRESERLRIVNDYVKSVTYIDKWILMTILGIEKESEG